MRLLSLLILLSHLIFVSSCGEDVGTNRSGRPLVTQQETEMLPVTFRTRLNNNLLVAGNRCFGGETVEDAGGEISTCLSGQFLILVDNVNTCDLSGCTQFTVVPFVGELQLLDRPIGSFSFFEILPIGRTTSEQQELLKDIILRSDRTGTQALFRVSNL